MRANPTICPEGRHGHKAKAFGHLGLDSPARSAPTRTDQVHHGLEAAVPTELPNAFRRFLSTAHGPARGGDRSAAWPGSWQPGELPGGGCRAVAAMADHNRPTAHLSGSRLPTGSRQPPMHGADRQTVSSSRWVVISAGVRWPTSTSTERPPTSACVRRALITSPSLEFRQAEPPSGVARANAAQADLDLQYLEQHEARHAAARAWKREAEGAAAARAWKREAEGAAAAKAAAAVQAAGGRTSSRHRWRPTRRPPRNARAGERRPRRIHGPISSCWSFLQNNGHY